MKKIVVIYILFVGLMAHAQKKDQAPNFKDKYYSLIDADSLMIHLNEVAILPKHKFSSRVDVRYYLWFKRKVYKAYPYAILAAKRLDSLNVRLDKITSKRKKKKYIKTVQSYLEKELTKRLKKLTRTEGRILLKLIHRQTGKTAFNNIKELRSGWKAFWYNTTANLFKLSLKSEYKPESENEDYLIEDVIQRAYINEILAYQEPKLKKEYRKIVSDRKGAINVNVYKEMFAKRKKKKAKPEKLKKVKKT
ncbi:protein of unknown function [Tenacibaculum sp. MAR_2009_124]|uniref:DUF4294 domain-containing protein n=1 Tax=Tenacibaculum sp. MAR_2009_124 TaxID=1250059 RepID=UPI00089A15A1|nr:DUF4294 domain-containing protein [Tenacibaculum sp. MAR_2009_124]SEB50830.1 protein of unknown function [Tenacibaculum sp. MAR_2009_124]